MSNTLSPLLSINRQICLKLLRLKRIIKFKHLKSESNCKMTKKAFSKNSGFTLVEIIVMVAITGIISAGVLTAVNSMRESASYSKDQKLMEEIKLSLLRFAGVNGYLPCPDTDGSGRENRDMDQSCVSASGQLPYIDLGTHAANAFKHPFSYHINTFSTDENQLIDSSTSASYFSNGNCSDTTTRNEQNAPCFKMSTPPAINNPGSGNYLILDGVSTTPIASNLPVVVISHGKNGCNGTSSFENQNCEPSLIQGFSSTAIYQSQHNKSGPNKFDDQVIWLSALEIKMADRMLVEDGSNGNGTNNEEDEPPLTIEEEYEPVVNPTAVDVIFRLWGALGDFGFGVGLGSQVFTEAGIRVPLIHSMDLNVIGTSNLVIQATETSGGTYLFNLGDQYRLSWIQAGSSREMVGTVSRSDRLAIDSREERNIVAFRGFSSGIDTVLLIDHRGVQQISNMRYGVGDFDPDQTVGFEAAEIRGTGPAGCTIIIRDRNENIIDRVIADDSGHWSAIIPNPDDAQPITAEVDDSIPCP